MRASEKVLDLVNERLGYIAPVPDWTTVRLWIIKLGLYRLQMTKTVASDWAWLVDHSVKLGPEKLFIILGVRLSDVPKGRPLSLKDLQVIDLFPTTESNGTVVHKQLLETSQKTGIIPCQIVTDGGPDLWSGVQNYSQSTNYHTKVIYDVKHKTANMLKKRLDNNEVWKSFLSMLKIAQSHIRQTELAPLMCPNQRSKSRYMNLEKLVRWGLNTISVIEEKKYDPFSTEDRVNQKLGWLSAYKQDLEIWNDLLSVAISAEVFLRTHGIYRGVTTDFVNQIDAIKLCEEASAFKDEFVCFLIELEYKSEIGQTLVASTEALEGLIGKVKGLANEQADSGFTKLMLAIPSLLGDIDESEVNEAMECVKVEEVHRWFKEKVGVSIQARRKELIGCRCIKTGENLLMAA